MKKKLVIALCLVMSLSLLLCSCGNKTDSSDSDNRSDESKTTIATTPSVVGGDTETPDATENEDPITTDAPVTTEPTEDVVEPTEDNVTDPTEGEATEPTENTTQPAETTQTQAKPTQTQTKPTQTTQTQAHKHNYTATVTKAATCSAEGVKTYTCSGCQHQYTEKITKTPHTKDSGTVTKAATCTATGTKTYKCSVCKTSMGTEDIKATGHSWSSWYCVKFANPVQTGLNERTCKTCKKTQQETVAKVKADAGTEVMVYENWTNSIQANKLSFVPTCAYWYDGRLYVEFYTANRTGFSYIVNGLKHLKLTNGSGVVIAELNNLKFDTSFTIANNRNDNSIRLVIKGSDIKNYTGDIAPLGWDCDYDAVKA